MNGYKSTFTLSCFACENLGPQDSIIHHSEVLPHGLVICVSSKFRVALETRFTNTRVLWVCSSRVYGVQKPWVGTLPSGCLGFPGGASGKEPACQMQEMQELRFQSQCRKDPAE